VSAHLHKAVAYPAINPIYLSIGLGVFFTWGMLSSTPFFDGSASAEDWGMLTVNYLFLLGLSQWGIAFSAIMRICRASWGNSFMRLAEIATLAFIPLAFALFLLIYSGGREALLYWVSDPNNHNPWLTESGLLWRNLLGMIAFYAISIVYYRQSGMMSIPHFHSTVYPMHIILGNMNGGTAVLLIWYLVFANQLRSTERLTVERLNWMAVMLCGFTLLWLYMFWAQFFVFWFGNLPHEIGPMWKQMYGHFGPYFWTMIVCVFGIPFVALIFSRFKKSVWAMTVLAVIVIFGVWLNRYLMIMSVVSDDHQPLQSFSNLAFLLGPMAIHWFLMLAWCRRIDPANTNTEVS
jgi:Ni/Fe-hydrogenase subunit HybB-like protein